MTETKTYYGDMLNSLLLFSRRLSEVDQEDEDDVAIVIDCRPRLDGNASDAVVPPCAHACMQLSVRLHYFD